MTKKIFNKSGSLILSVLLTITMMSSTAFAQENVIGEPLEQQAEMQGYPADEDTLNLNSDAAVQIAAENEIGLKTAVDTYLTESDLQRNSISAARRNIGTQRLNDLSAVNANNLLAENEINISTGNSMMTRAATSNGFYTAVTDYLTAAGQQKYIYPITVGNGQMLHIQGDMPNSSQLDYDLYLFEVDANGNMTLVDYSEYATYINGTSGTLAEAVGIYNTSGTTKDYAVFIQSYIGASISQSFTLHVAINTNTDPFEADENTRNAIPFTLQAAGNTKINVRSMDTLADNDWYVFSVPSNKNYTRAAFTLDAASVTAGYKLEVYTKTSGGGMKKETMSGSKVSLSSGTYYLRVSSVGVSNLTPANYTLTISPEYIADQVIITELGGGGRATYYGVNCYRVNGNSTLTVKGVAGSNGFVLPNATITVTVLNENWNPEDLRYRTVTVTTDSEGNFTANILTSHSTASMSCYLSGAISFIHYYDIGFVYAQSGNAISEIIPIYIFAYSVYA